MADMVVMIATNRSEACGLSGLSMAAFLIRLATHCLLIGFIIVRGFRLHQIMSAIFHLWSVHAFASICNGEMHLYIFPYLYSMHEAAAAMMSQSTIKFLVGHPTADTNSALSELPSFISQLFEIGKISSRLLIDLLVSQAYLGGPLEMPGRLLI